MISDYRLIANAFFVEHIVKHSIEGDFVEAGVWKGGSSLAMILALESFRSFDREVHLYDTYAGMTAPADIDVSQYGILAKQHLQAGDPHVVANASLAEVQQNIYDHLTLFPRENIKFHVGDIVQSLYIPSKIAFLRLDTDWYASTKWELENMAPRVSPGGIVIVDDYGFWSGSRRATDEYLSQHPELIMRHIEQGAVCWQVPF